ncbi:MAG: hypothetical protein Q8P26_02805 [Candidatus Levybacteria bacterium]|nr:hypothetical protein [Candidatus Levybacteria bacterium]
MAKEQGFPQGVEKYINEGLQRAAKKSTAEQKDKADREKHERSSVLLWKKAEDLLRRYGERRTRIVGAAAGRGIVGYRDERHTYHRTPGVSVEVGGKEFDLVLEEDFTSSSGYRVSMDRVKFLFESKKGQKNPETTEGVLFEVNFSEKSTENMQGEKAKPGEIRVANDMLSAIEKSLLAQFGQEIKRKPVSHPVFDALNRQRRKYPAK